MDVRSCIFLFVIICVQRMRSHLQDFMFCDDDYNFKLTTGFVKDHTFPWLGFVQYVHPTGRLHESKAPRVVLIQRQFILATAIDLVLLPKTYKLGNVIFGYYEREERACGLTAKQIKDGVKCPRASIEVPLVEIIPHPEFARFGMENSIALGRLLTELKSPYMVPVCLPSLIQRKRLRTRKIVYLVDYTSTVPLHMEGEEIAMKMLKLYTHRDCDRHRAQSGLSTSDTISQVLCTSGCGIRPGAPIITQAPDGRIELVGIAVGGETCTEKYMRNRLNPDPPVYMDIYPYVSWIVNVISAFHIPKAYPETFRLVEGGARLGYKDSFSFRAKKQRTGWNGRTFLSGNACYDDFKTQASMSAFFYSETFEVLLKPPFNLEVKLKVFAGSTCDIVCVRVVLPNRLSRPTVTGLGTSNITMVYDVSYCPHIFRFVLLLTGTNSSLVYG